MIEAVRDHWLLLLVLAVAVLGSAFGLGPDAPVARRVFGRFVLYIALPLVVTFGLPLLVLALSVDLSEGLWQAIIAGAVIATGWLTTAIFGELGKARERAERLRDYHKALFAEIRTTLSVLYDEGRAQADADEIVRRMDADPDFVPLIPRERHDFLYDAIAENIEVLPRVTIDAIVAYYSHVKAIAALAEDMRGEVYAKLSQPRRIAMYRDYFEMRRRAYALGEFTLKLIREYSDRGEAATTELARRLSTPDGGRNGPSPGSA